MHRCLRLGPPVPQHAPEIPCMLSLLPCSLQEQASAVAAALPPSSVTSGPSVFPASFVPPPVPSSTSLCSSVNPADALPFEALLMSPSCSAPVNRCRDTLDREAPQPPPPPPPPGSAGHEVLAAAPGPSSSFGSCSQPSPSPSDPFLLSASFGDQHGGRARKNPPSTSVFDCLSSEGSDSSASVQATRPAPHPPASRGGRGPSGSDRSHSGGLDPSLLFAATGLPAPSSSPGGECVLAPLPKLPAELFGPSRGADRKLQGGASPSHGRPPQPSRPTVAHREQAEEACASQGRNDTCTTSTTPSSSRASSW